MAVDVLSKYRNFALVFYKNTAKYVYRRGFACAVNAQKGKKTAGFYVKRNPVYRFYVAVGFFKPFDFNNVFPISAVFSVLMALCYHFFLKLSIY